MLIRINNQIINTNLLLYSYVTAIYEKDTKRLNVEMRFVFNENWETAVEFTTVLLNDTIRMSVIENRVSDTIFDLIGKGDQSLDFSHIVGSIVGSLEME